MKKDDILIRFAKILDWIIGTGAIVILMALTIFDDSRLFYPLHVIAIVIFVSMLLSYICYVLKQRKRKKTSNITFSEEDKKLSAYHEAGHTVVAKLLTIQNVKKVSIIPSEDCSEGGYTEFKSEFEKYIPKKMCQEQIIILLAGRAAEQIVFNDISTGANEDLELATSIAIDMVTIYGMDEEIGPISLVGENYEKSELMGVEIFNKIGCRIQEIMKNSEKEATQILKTNREFLDRIADELLQKGTLCGEEIEEIMKEMM